MQYTMLGSGTYIIRPERHAASHLVELNNGRHFLLDCGHGATLNLLQTGHRLADLDAIFITHPHADHMGELMSLLGSMHGEHQRGTARRSQPLSLFGYPGFTADYIALRQIFWPGLTEPYSISVEDLTQDTTRKFGPATISVREVPHSPHFRALAISIEVDGKKIVYSGDCGMNAALPDLAAKADLLICENGIGINSYLTSGPQLGHLSPVECGQIAAKAQVKQLVLTHLYDSETESAILEAVAKHYQGPVTVGYDRLTQRV